MSDYALLSDEQADRVFEEAAEGGEVLGGGGSVDDAVVAGEGGVHFVADDDLLFAVDIADDGLFDGCADGDDGGVGGVDDGIELGDAVLRHAEVADGDGGVGHLLG